MELAVIDDSSGQELAGIDGSVDGAAWFTMVAAIAEATLSGESLNILEGILDTLLDIPELNLTHSRSINDQCTVIEADQFAMASGMLSAVVDFANLPNLLAFVTEQLIEDCRFTDAGGADERDGAAGQEPLPEMVDPLVAQGADRMTGNLGGNGFDLSEACRQVVAEIGLGEEDNGSGAALPGDRKVAFEPAWIEVLIERGCQEDDIDIGGDDLLIGPGALDLAGEVAAAGQERVDGRLLLTSGTAKGDPVANGRQSGTAGGAVTELAGSLGKDRAARCLDAQELIELKADAARFKILAVKIAKAGGKMVIPSPGFEAHSLVISECGHAACGWRA